MSVFFSLQVSSISLRKLIAAESERKKNDNRPNALINTKVRKYWYKVLSPLGWRKKKSVRLKWHTIYSYELIYMTIICTHKIEANQIGQSIKSSFIDRSIATHIVRYINNGWANFEWTEDRTENDLTLCIWHFRVVSYVLYSLQFVRITREQTKNKRRNKKSPRVPRNRRHHHHRHFQCINWKRFDLFSIDFLRLCALIFDRLFIHRSSWRICPIEYRTERPSQRARITSNSSHHMRRLWR